MKIYLRKLGTWKIQLSIETNFISSKNFIDDRVMHSKSDNKETAIRKETDEVTEGHFESHFIDIKKEYQN